MNGVEEDRQTDRMLGVSSSVVSKFAVRKPEVETSGTIAQLLNQEKKDNDKDKIVIQSFDNWKWTLVWNRDII